MLEEFREGFNTIGFWILAYLINERILDRIYSHTQYLTTNICRCTLDVVTKMPYKCCMRMGYQKLVMSVSVVPTSHICIKSE